MAKRKASSGVRLEWLWWPLRILLAVVLPFFLLVRGSVLLYDLLEITAWQALGASTLLTFAFLYFYLNWLVKRIHRRKKAQEKTRRFSWRAALVVLGGFIVYALLYLSASNAKTSTVQSEYSSMHPLLRMAVSVWLIFDRDGVVTDMSRTHADYGIMNLVDKERSLHYPQADGYVHALDLRTKGRAEAWNGWADTYFKLMGFRTLRHTGTEDHLHISLKIHENPAAL
jgi:hypothetical protein